MNIHFERSGGFAGLRSKHDIAASDLTAEERDTLHRLLESSHFFQLPSQLRAPNPGADRFQYKIAVDDGNREHAVDLDEAAIPDDLRPLIEWLRSKSRKG